MINHVDELQSIFQASLSTDLQSRHHAESQLNSLQLNPGFVSTLFSLVASSDQPLPSRQAAAIYLKNLIKLSYDPLSVNLNGSPSTSQKISDQDRAFLKQHLLQAIASVPTSIRTLLVPTLAAIITVDYPDRWPELLTQSIHLIGSNEFPIIEAGLLALLEVMRLYRWSGREKSELRSKAINLSFPTLLQLSQNLISQAPENYSFLPTPSSLAEANSNLGTLLYLILKIYKTSITAELPAFQQHHIVPWGQLFLASIQKPLKNSPGFPLDSDDRNRWGWSKAKKWAYFILNRLYSRYGSPSQLPSSMQQYRPFAEKFITSFACPILRLYLEQVDLFIRDHDWMSRKVICHTIVFFEESIRPKETWSVLKSQVPVLLSRFIFPLLCITPEEVLEFENQPEDYVRSQFAEFFEDVCSNPSTISAGFILALASGRKKTMFMSLLTFITDVCAKNSVEGTREKDGALRSLAHLASIITETKAIRANIEEFFSTYIFPEFHSKCAFLRARTCEVVRKFEVAGAEWSKPELLNAAYQGVIQCLSDPSLPVRVQAALTLPELCEHPQVHEGVAPHIGQIMKGLLALSNEVDLDSLTQATRSLVSKFSDELLPFAAEMAQALHQSYMRLMSEIADVRRRLGDVDDDDSSEEKILVAMNILKTLQQLVVGLEGNVDVLYQVEAAAIPLIKYTLKEEIVEIYDEALELLDSTQFALKMITHEQWELFDIIYDVFKTSGADFIAEMFPALDNYLSYGTAYISTRPETMNKMLDIYLNTMTSKTLSCSDRIIACKLADSMLLCLRGHTNAAVPMFLEHTMKIIQRSITTVEPVTTKSLLMHALEVVLNAIYYNPALSMDVLIKNGWSSDFFSEWFGRLTSFKRAHDKKLSLLAISAILSISLNEGLDSVLVQSSGQLVVGALTLFEGLPNAIRTRFELEKKYNFDSDDESDVYSEEGSKDDTGENDDEDVIDPTEERYQTHPASRKNAESRGDDHTAPPSSLWSDEILWETPLDRVDVYCEFAAVMKNIETSGRPILNAITENLTEEQRTSLQNLLKQASEGGEREIRSQIQESVQVNQSWA